MGEINRSDEIAKTFPEKHSGRVQLTETVTNALHSINSNMSDYDCVVLDVNLKKGCPNEVSAKEKIKEQLTNAGVQFPDDKATADEGYAYFMENTGYYLYLYLVCKGFPKERIIMRTAYNGDDAGNLTKKWDNSFKGAKLCPPDNFGKNDGNDDFFKKVNSLYSNELGNENQYYVIRRLILDATNYWINELKDRDINDFMFNVAVESNKKLSADELLKLLEDIKVSLPTRRSKKINEIFSDILRKISMPFEARVTFSNVNENPNAYVCLSLMRLMRNWYAHSLFNNPIPTVKEFVLLFIISLRALFDNGKKKSTEPIDYEMALLVYIKNNDLALEINKSETEELIYKFFSNTYKETMSKVFTTDYIKMLEALGRDSNAQSKCSYSKLIEIIWTSRYNITLKFNNSPNIKQTENYPDSTNVYINFEPNGNINNNDILNSILCIDYQFRKSEKSQH